MSDILASDYLCKQMQLLKSTDQSAFASLKILGFISMPDISGLILIRIYIYI